MDSRRVCGSRTGLAAAVAVLSVLLLAGAAPADAQAIIKISDTASLKFGVLLQGWADWTELPNASNTDTIGYQQNFYLRRARILFAGRLAKDVYFWFETENSNLGRAAAPSTNKALGTGLQVLTAWGEWRIADEFMLEGGLIRVPYSRIAMTSAAFIPCYNEAANVSAMYQALEKTLIKIAKKHEIIIINDGSRDHTGSLADSLAKQHHHVDVIHHPQNLGYGMAFRSGVSAARYQWIFFTDGDLQFDIQELEKFIPYTNKYNTVIGYRVNRAEGQLLSHQCPSL